MAMNDSPKRKEPEPAAEVEAKKEEEVAKAADLDQAKVAEPDAKRLKATAPDAAIVRKQVEYYLSDENLKYDKFFHDKITENSDGWLEMSLVLTCNKMKAMRATKENVMASLKDSTLETKDDGALIRRPGNAALPKLEDRPQHQKKGSANAHAGGVIAVFKGLPEEQSWMQVKEKLKAALPEKTGLWFVSEVSDKNQCFVATAPFVGDVAFFEKTPLDFGGAMIKAEICQGDVLQQGLKLLPKHIRERRDKESRKQQKERNKPIVVGTQKFVNVGALRGRVKEILNSRSNGESLKPDGSDFKLISALLEHHPKGEEKRQGMVGIKVAQSTQGENQCFFMVKADGTAEDFSAKKCMDALEANPPYEKAATAAASPPAAKEAASPAKGEGATGSGAEVAASPAADAAPAAAEVAASDAPEKAADAS